MNNKLISTAVIAGLLSGISLVKAEEATHETTTTKTKKIPDDNSCKGRKSAKKDAKKDKMACGGKNGCGEAAKAKSKE